MATISPAGVRNETSLNELGWVVESRSATAVEGGEMSPLNYVTRYRYDANGNQVETHSPYGDGSTFTKSVRAYGILDQVETVSREVTPGGEMVQTTFDYDDAFDVRLETGPENRITETLYDGRGLVDQVTRGYGSADAYTETYSYNLEGALETASDLQNNTRTTQYDGFGRRRASIDPLQNKEIVTYDMAGQTASVKKVDDVGQLLASSRYLYDHLGRSTNVLRDRFEMGQGGASSAELEWKT